MPFVLGQLSDLQERRARVVLYPGAPPQMSILVVRAGEAVHAYWNVCQHIPVPLDAGTRALPEGDFLVCLTHGARYEPTSGLCVRGPCVGKLLEPIRVQLDRARDLILALI